MAFKSGRRTGVLWDDLNTIVHFISSFSFNLSNKSERQFENTFASSLLSQKDKINGKIVSQIDKDVKVESVYCFGKKHRPDLTINDDGIAVEIKYTNESLDGFKQAIGQSFIYRLRYKFVVNVIILSEKNREMYNKIVNKEEMDLEDIVKELSKEYNIFSFIVPAFKVKTGQPKVFTSIDMS